MQQPITNPPVPYVGPIQGGFTPGSMIRVQGQVPPTADRFDINLHCGTPPSDTALHLSVRLLQNYVARNSLEGGAWGTEEDSGSLPITPGQSFEILLLCDPSSYKIAVNGEHFGEFRHRIPFQQVSHLAVNGDVNIRAITFEGGASAPPPPMTGGSDYAFGGPPQYGPPPSQYGPPTGPYGQGPYGGGPPRPPGHQEESGFDQFLETAGTVIAGAIASGAAQNLLGGLTGSGGQAQQQHYQPPPPPPPPQQPLFPLGGQGSVGGLGSVGSLLQTFAGQVLAGPKKQQIPAAPPKPASSVSMPIPSSAPLPPANMPMPSSVPIPPATMPMPSSVPLQPSSMPMPSPAPLPPPPYMPPRGSGYMPPTYPPSQMPPYGAPPSYVPPPPPTGTYPRAPPSYPTQPPSYPRQPPSYPTQPPSYPAQPPSYPAQPPSYPTQPPSYPTQPPSYPTHPRAPPAYPAQPMAPHGYPTQPCPAYPAYAPPMYQQQNVKKSKLKTAMKYGLPIAGVGLGAYALSQAFHSCSSSSDSD